MCDDVDTLLDKIRINSIHLSNAHKAVYDKLENSLKWYKLPVIIISGLSSLLSVSQDYISQYYITIGNSTMGLLCSIIVSLEMYFRISLRLSSAMQSTKDFYNLATDIFKYLCLSVDKRTENSTAFLEQSYGQYVSLCEHSDFVEITSDTLLPLTDIVQTLRTLSQSDVSSSISADSPGLASI